MSSMRTSQRPFAFRAYNHEPTAATRLPRCSGPVGDGAKRPVGTFTPNRVRSRSQKSTEDEMTRVAVATFLSLITFAALAQDPPALPRDEKIEMLANDLRT